jgi:hypothetical protein
MIKQLLAYLKKQRYTNIDCRTDDGITYRIKFLVPGKGFFNLVVNDNIDFGEICDVIESTLVWRERYKLVLSPTGVSRDDEEEDDD